MPPVEGRAQLQAYVAVTSFGKLPFRGHVNTSLTEICVSIMLKWMGSQPSF